MPNWQRMTSLCSSEELKRKKKKMLVLIERRQNTLYIIAAGQSRVPEEDWPLEVFKPLQMHFNIWIHELPEVTLVFICKKPFLPESTKWMRFVNFILLNIPIKLIMLKVKIFHRETRDNNKVISLSEVNFHQCSKSAMLCRDRVAHNQKCKVRSSQQALIV